MSLADVFLVCFLGCLFALGVASIAVFQIGRRKFYAMLREHGRAVASMNREAAAAAEREWIPASMPDPVVRCECGREQAFGSGIDPKVVSDFLGALGWEAMDPDWRLRCPACALKIKMERAAR
jgi:hypothetical protein